MAESEEFGVSTSVRKGESRKLLEAFRVFLGDSRTLTAVLNCLQAFILNKLRELVGEGGSIGINRVNTLPPEDTFLIRYQIPSGKKIIVIAKVKFISTKIWFRDLELAADDRYDVLTEGYMSFLKNFFKEMGFEEVDSSDDLD